MTAAQGPVAWLAARRLWIIRWCRWCTLACAVVLTLGSVMPSDPQATGIWAWDHNLTPDVQNVLHVPAYAALAGAMMWGWWRPGRMARRAAVILLLCSAYGALLECAQAVIPGRCGSVSDATLNVLGAAVGTAVAWLAGRKLLSNGQPAGTPGKVG